MLVDKASHQAYVAERTLEAGDLVTPIRHPLLEHYCGGFEQDRYIPRNTRN